MRLTTCRLCARAFPSDGPTACPQCAEKLDSLFRQVREYLRDNPQKALNAEALAAELGIDIRYVQALIEMGHLERSVPGEATDETQTKRGFVRNLRTSPAKSAEPPKEASAGMHARKKYGDKGKRRK